MLLSDKNQGEMLLWIKLAEDEINMEWSTDLFNAAW